MISVSPASPDNEDFHWWKDPYFFSTLHVLHGQFQRCNDCGYMLLYKEFGNYNNSPIWGGDYRVSAAGGFCLFFFQLLTNAVTALSCSLFIPYSISLFCSRGDNRSQSDVSERQHGIKRKSHVWLLSKRQNVLVRCCASASRSCPPCVTVRENTTNMFQWRILTGGWKRPHLFFL